MPIKFYNIQIVIEKEEDNGYYAYSPNLPGCFSNGDTIEETRANMYEAIHLHLESLLAHSEPFPQVEHPALVETMSIGIPE
ncbi:MAG: HicB_like antitoxin of bacterial toxin-antitoxinsystem [Candidatus Argoarchaeum ethanivorans]|uniref:HicB_like antitoxin of bacterial toxin-antitoxinsystem n=1 Tax=Candidatus Argoarchaeum ethanivorans TaxID=2608793 RepID=A0A811TA76_9EURY|nr:MAG: HicB_like antitoxin of bacterial toxin-antitoxinsystem [Candidatus Argoarchaeum ethanivorans]